MGGGRVVEVHSSAEWSSILNSTGAFGGGSAVVVDFSATWCGPCQAIGPVFVSLSEKYSNVKFVKIDVDELQDVAQSCNVTAMPTFHAYFNGQLVDTLTGADPRKLQVLIETVNSKVGSAGAGQKLGGETSAPAEGADSVDARRARMLAAAEARMNAGAS